MGQVNYVRIIDRQVSNDGIIGPGRMDTDSSCLSVLCRPVVQSKRVWIFNRCLWRSVQFWLHEGAGCHGLVGPGSARRRGRRSFFLIRVLVLFCRSFLVEELTLWAPCAHACWPAVDSYISQLSSVRWSWLVNLHRQFHLIQKGTILKFVRLKVRKGTAGWAGRHGHERDSWEFRPRLPSSLMFLYTTIVFFYYCWKNCSNNSVRFDSWR